jgi:hypothetical protein
MDTFKIDIEESKLLIVKGVLCLIRFDGRKLYVKLGKADKNGMLELVPMSKEELLEQNIEESEQIINSEFWDIEIEESTPEFSDPETERIFREEQEKLKKKNFNLNDIEDAKRAKAIAEKAIATLEKPNAEEEIQRLRDERDDYRGKLEMIAQMELERKRRQLGAPDSITTPEELMAYEKGLKDSHGDLAGSAPLNVYQLGENKLGFETVEQMIQHLRDNPSPENELILRKLWEKTFSGMSQKKNFEIEYDSDEKTPKSNATEVEISLFEPKDSSVESDKEKYDKVLRRNRKKNRGEIE